MFHVLLHILDVIHRCQSCPVSLELAAQVVTCTHYIDDMMVHMGTFDGHIKVLTELLERLNDTSPTLGDNKCYLIQPEVRILGHVVSAEGIRPDPKRILAIKVIKLPTSYPEFDSALGIMENY
jgi:hypothetical protein